MTEIIKQPPPEIVHRINQMLEERGINLPPEHIDMSIAMMSHWLATEQRGNEYMAHLQQLDAVRGRHEKIYKLRDGFGRLTSEVDPENIIFLRGCLIDGEPVPVSSIEISDREAEHCESCGSRTICTENIRSNRTDIIETLCSHCMGCNEDLSIRDTAEIACEDCTYQSCNWHPINLDVPAFNPAI